MRIMVFQGSPRRKDNCPGQWGKTKLLIDHLVNYSNHNLNIELDVCDLSVGPDTRIGPCKGCVSTAGGFHCHYPCDCYAPNAPDPTYRDYLHDANVYERLEACDGFMVVTPINWYSASSQIKLLFDRLTCINLTITTDQAEQLGLGKDPEKTAIAEQSGELRHLLQNHYEGKVAAFFVHGDQGGNDYYEFAKEKHSTLPRLPLAYTKETGNGSAGWIDDPRNVVQNLVWQCRYSGIFVPESCILGINATKGICYSCSMEKAITDLEEFYIQGEELLAELISQIDSK